MFLMRFVDGDKRTTTKPRTDGTRYGRTIRVRLESHGGQTSNGSRCATAKNKMKYVHVLSNWSIICSTNHKQGEPEGLGDDV